MGSLTQVDFTNGDVVRACLSVNVSLQSGTHAYYMCWLMQYGYRMGKAALHIAGITLARDFKKRGIPVGLIHPGVVRDFEWTII